MANFENDQGHPKDQNIRPEETVSFERNQEAKPDDPDFADILVPYGTHSAAEAIVPTRRDFAPVDDGFIDVLAARIARILNETQEARTSPATVSAEQASVEPFAGAAAPLHVEDTKSSWDGSESRDDVMTNYGPTSHIAAGATVSGGVHDYGDGEVRIGGKFTPDKLTCGDLTILAGAYVRGDIYASGLVRIYGKVEETEILAQGIEVYETAEINGGSLKSETIGIEVGAQISGTITTRTLRNQQTTERE